MSKAIQFKNNKNENIYPCPYYPIDSIYLSFNNVDPGTIFGGVWVQIKDTFLLGAGNIYKKGNTGGSATIKIAENNLPSRAMIRQVVSGTKYGCACNTQITNTWANICMTDGTFTNSQPLNNMPPYTVVYMWRRIS